MRLQHELDPQQELLPAPGVTILVMIARAVDETFESVSSLMRHAQHEPDPERAKIIKEFTVEALIRRYHDLDQKEVHRLFQLDGIDKLPSREEAREKGIKKGIKKGIARGKHQIIANLLADGHTSEEIAKLLGISLAKIDRMFKVRHVRKTRVWQEAYEEGIKKGLEEGVVLEWRRAVEHLQSNGQTQEQIAQLLGVSVAEVRRLANKN